MKSLLAAACVLMLAACSGGGSGDSGNGGPGSQKVNPVNWGAVPAEDNPSIESLQFDTQGAQRIKISIMDYKQDVNLVYSDAQPANTVALKLYRVWKKSASWPNTSATVKDGVVSISSFGNYQCSIDIKDGAITSLEGGCYVRLDIVMPAGAQVEVFNAGTLLTQRFVAVSNAEFIANVKSAMTPEKKTAAVDDYLASYSAVGRSPVLSTVELGAVIHEFIWKEPKLEVLRRLHSFVTDRENLGKMIDHNFNYFDRAEARAIVGI